MHGETLKISAVFRCQCWYTWPSSSVAVKNSV